MKKKHIVLILQGGKGGTHEYLKMLLGKLDRSKYVITAICHGEVYAELHALGHSVYYVEMTRKISVWQDMLSLVKIWHYLGSHKIDLVYCHSSKAGILGRIAASLLHIPSIYNPHGWSFNMNVSKNRKWFYVLVEKIASKLTRKFIMISEAEYNDAVINRITNRNKLALIVNGIDLERFDKRHRGDLKRRLNIPQHYKVVGMMGRLTEQKSPQTFIDIAEIVTASYTECVFLLIGDGILKKTSENKVRETKLGDKVVLTGWVDDPEKYISIMDIGVLTSRWEGFGLTLVEMMASGKPVVASEVDGIPHIVSKNVDGYLCNPNDVHVFADYILKLLNEESVYKTMSESAYKNAREKYNMKRFIRQHEEVFDAM